MTDPLNAGDYIDVTITLSQAVTNLSFRLHDIDKTGSTQQYGWNDEVLGPDGRLHRREGHQRDRHRHGRRRVPQQRVRGPGDRLRSQPRRPQVGRSALAGEVPLPGAQLRQLGRTSTSASATSASATASPTRTSAPVSRRSHGRRLAASCLERRGLSSRGGTTDPPSLTGRRPGPIYLPGVGSPLWMSRADRLDSRAAARASRLPRLPRRGHPVRAGSAVIDWAGPSCRPSARSASVAGVP